jgi:hypothetical protein
MDVIDQANKILREQRGWIELDLDFDLEIWKKEAALVENDLVDHREGENHVGWKSCCLHGISKEKTGHWSIYAEEESDVEYGWTEIERKVPTIAAFWKNIPVEKYARLRFMKLEPNGFIAPHCDAPDGLKNTEYDMMNHIIPINLSITHPADCFMNLEKYGTVPWKEGKAFIVNITDTHSVHNQSDLPRMHMIAHCIVGNKKKEFSEFLVSSYYKKHDSRI